jgi:hypothetical protein
MLLTKIQTLCKKQNVKILERKILLHISLFLQFFKASGSFEKSEVQESPNFQNLKFVKNTSFSKFSQNLSFYLRDLRPKKKLLQIT